MPTYEQEKKKTVQRTAPRAWDSSQLPPERQTNTQQTSQKWYAGENPTWRETLAQIYKVSGDDKQKRTSLYNKYNAMRQDPTSVLYDPYTQATTTKQNTTNINTTNKALREWDDLSRELSFWATSSRNYSDDEIIANIDWKKYPTLAKMDAGRESGKPLALLTSVGYSKDAMHGVIWGARNPDQKSDNLEMDAVKSVLGRGNTYKRDENIAQRLNKASSTYAPYTVGGTMDDLMVKYGTETFDDKWLADNAYMKLDRDMADDYATIYYANQNTKELQQMAEEWKTDVLRKIEKGVSLKDIFDEEELESDYNKLYNLLESQRSSRLVNTTAAIDFDWEGMRKVAAEAYLKKNGTLSTTEYEQQMNDLTGGTHKQSDVDAEIENGWMLNTDILGKQDMTPAESRAFKAKASAGYSDVVFTAADGVANGTGGYAEMQRGLINEANALAGKNLLNVMRGLAEGNRNTLADFVPEQDLKALHEYFPEQYAEGRLPTQEEFNAKRAESSKDPSKEDFWFDFESQIYSLWNTEAIVSQERDQTAQYQEQLAEIEDAVAEAYGGKDTDQYRAFFASYEYAWDIMNQPDTFDEYDAFQRAAMAEGFDTSKAGDYLLSYAGNAGSDVLKAQAALENAKKMGMGADAIAALEKDLAKKQKNLALVNAHYLTANKDYSSQVKAFDEAYNDGTVTAAAGEHSAEVLAAVVNPEAAQDFAIANRYGKPGQAGMYTALLETAELSMVMTGEERSNYKYLYATKGEEAATAYFDALSENLIVRKSMQDSEARQEWAGENVGNAILATAGSIAVSPVTALEGVVNTLSALFGKDLNPHKDFKVAMAQSDLRTGVKDGVAEAADNEIVSGIFNAVYDAVTSAGDTLVASTTGGAWTMALSAMNSSMMDARMRGADTKTALAYGAANAVIELGTEKLGMDRIADAFKKKGAGGVRELLGEMLSGFANEFGEETVGNIAGQLTDDLIMGNMSNYNNAVQQYMDIGLSEEAAKAQAARDSLKEILYGGLVGGLSGGLTSGIGFAAGSVAGENNTTEATQKPAEAPAEQTPPVYQGTEKERAVSALSAAQGEGVGEVKQQATVQGVLQGLGVSAQESSAAAKMIMDNAGMKMAQWLIAKSDNPQDVAKALTFAQLVPQSRSAAVLGTKVNSENANAVGRELLEAYKVDSADSKNVEQYETAVHESALADAAVEILEKEGSEAIAKANRDKKEREQEKREKTTDFRRKSAAAESAANALKEASAAVAQDASPENIKRQSEANKELQKAKSAREQARVAMEEANAKAKDAAEVEKKVVRNAQNSARMQAQQYVAQETEQRKAVEAEKAVKVEQERAAADVKRQVNNVTSLEADEFVETYLPNAPEDVKEQVRQQYMAYDGETKAETADMQRFTNQISRKFGVKISFVDSHGIFEGANLGAKGIVLDVNATQDEVIRRVLVHEIIHSAETSQSYGALSTAVLEVFYNGDSDRMNADLKAIGERYAKQTGQKGDNVARSELVAARLSEMISGNQEALNRLVQEKPNIAQQIWRAVKDFVNKMRGVTSPEMDTVLQLEKMLEGALGSRDDSKANSYGNVNTQFNLSGNVEETRDLIAVHNLTEDNMRSVLELGGLAMPSIAVIKAEQGHSQYGTISVVFDKNTIDPKASSANEVYGGDAWTPTFPQVEYEADEKVESRIRKKYYELEPKVDAQTARVMYSYIGDLAGEIDRKGGVEKIIEHLEDNIDMMQMYLADNGFKKIEPVKKTIVKRTPRQQAEQYESMIQKMGEDVMRSFATPEGGKIGWHRKAWMNEHMEALKQAYVEVLTEATGLPKENVEVLAESGQNLYKMARDTYYYLETGGETSEEVVDYETFEKEIRDKVDKKAYKKWLEDLFKGAVKRKGIRNDKDLFTSNGNRRSFSSTHWDVTLDNVVRAMRGKEKTGAGMLGRSIEGAAVKKYSSIQDVKADSDRLRTIPEEEYKTMRKNFRDRFRDISGEFAGNKDWINAGDVLVEYITKSQTADGIYKLMQKDAAFYKPSRDVAEKLAELVEEMKNAPTGYFEAKPRRAVGFEEMAAVIIPDNLSEDVRTGLEDKGVAVLEYKAGDEADRLNKLNSDAVSGLRFSLPSNDVLNQQIAAHRAEVASGEPWEERQKKSQFATQTGQNTNVLTPETKQKLLADPYYTSTSQKKEIANAVNHIEKEGYEKRRDKMLYGETSMKTPSGQAEAYVLMKLAKESGDSEAEAALAFKVKESGTELAQSLAMRRLYTQMTPAGKLEYVQKAVDKINADYEARGKDTRVELPEWLAGALEKADGDSVATEQALDDAYREIAQQMPYSFKDWESTWRYLAMLGNPMTHAKNVIGNAVYMPYVAMRDTLTAAMQLTKSKEERTRTLAPIKKEYREFAKVITAAQKKLLTGESTATEKNALGKIDEYRQKGPKWMDKLSTLNSEAMQNEDLFFKNRYFTRSLAGYLQAKGADLNNLSPEMLNSAIQFALGDAKKNTFNNINQFAQIISGWQRDSEQRGVGGKIASHAIDAILPFKNTPANVLARGIDFSPVGLVRTLTLDWYKVKHGKMTSTEFLDNLSAGVVGGMAMTGLGFLLASIGALHVDEDEVEGKQENSVDIFGQNITIDWMGTAAMPILMGGRMFQLWEDEGKQLIGEDFELTDIPNLITLFGSAMREITDPMINLSVLQGVKNFVESASYSGDNALSAMATKTATTYASQFVPSFLGAVARIADDTRRTTYTDKNSGVPSDMQYFGQSIRNKIPVLSWQSTPYMDAWGNDESNGPWWRRMLNNLLLPGYSRSIESPDEVEKMLADLYDTATAQNISGADAANLKAASKSFSVNGETYNMTAKEYEKMSKVRGQTAYDLLQQLMQQEEFYNGSDYYKVKAVGYVWDYANTIAKREINADYAPDSAKWVLTTKDPFGSVMEKAASAAKNYENDQLRLALYDAIRDGRSDEIQMYQEALIENGVKESSLKTSITNELKAEYLTMYSEDQDAALGLEYSLRETGLFKTKDFNKWMKED